MMITAAKFKKAVGYAPKDDDLDRCNCPLAGQIGHIDCGWNHDMGKPVFIAKAMMLKLAQDEQHQNLLNLAKYGLSRQSWTGLW